LEKHTNAALRAHNIFLISPDPGLTPLGYENSALRARLGKFVPARRSWTRDECSRTRDE